MPYVAAFLTVITLGFDPFVQQLLTTQGRVVRIPASGISINSTTSVTLDIVVAMEYPETLAQLTAAMLADVQQEDQPMDISTKRKRSDATTQTLASPLQAACPSGNCIWQPYHALDICTQCRTTTEDVTIKNLSPESSALPAMISDALAAEKLNNDQYSSNFTWEIIPKSGRTWRVDSNLTAFVNENAMDGTPKGLETHGAIVHKVLWPLNFAGSNAFSLDPTGWSRQRFAGIDEPVAAIGFAEFDFDHRGLPALNYSLECAVTYCVKEYNRSVVQGNLVSNVLSTHYGTVSGDPDAYSDLSWSATVNGTSFTVDAFLGYGTGIGTMVGYMLGNTTHAYSGGCSASDGWSCTAPVTSNSGTYGAISAEAWQGIDLTLDFTTVLDNVNTLMSEILQQYGNVTVVGENAVTQSFVVVRWAWIALPATVVFFGLIVLGLTVWETMRLQAPSWKSSLLPLLYRYVHVENDSAEGQRNRVAKGPASNRSPPASDGYLRSSNLVSRFALEAEATVTRLIKETTALQVWQLQSLETVQADTKRWWQWLK